MPYLSSLLRERGTTFSRCYATTPICGPSRASILRGQYAHNHGVLRNGGENGGFPAFHAAGHEASTIATWLQEAGYTTGLVGKYLNGYPRISRRRGDPVPRTYVPPGWDEWYGVMDRGARGGPDFILNENGWEVAYEDGLDSYSTDVLARHAVDFLDRAAVADAPFFLYLATLVPHAPAVPAARHAAAFPDASAPRPPSFDEPDVTDKPAHLRDAPRLSHDQIRAIDESHANRLRSLLSLDELIDRVVATLRGRGVLDTTYLIVTSDHGWHQGEHRLPLGKETPYEESIRVPLGVIGPGVAAGRIADDLALNIDLAPTVADLAGAEVPPFVDGRSLTPILHGETLESPRRCFLVEHASAGRTRAYPGLGEMPVVPTYQAVRCRDDQGDILYVEYVTGECELYDLSADPFQLDNRALGTSDDLLLRCAERLAGLRHCASTRCRAIEDVPLDPAIN